MNRIAVLLVSASIAGVFAGCSSTPTAEQPGAAVEDRKPDGAPGTIVDRPPVKPVAPTTKGVQTDPFAGSPLKDPNNILSKRSVFFDYDSNLVKDEFKPLVSAHARYLQQHGGMKMRIEGNADERGSREYNLALGQRRADAVRQMMQLLGARADQIETVSFGEEKPRCTTADEGCYAQNRRADIAYQGE
jgi:peptidoglycan-associated lipoprotein